MLFQTIQASVIVEARSILVAANTPKSSLVPSLSYLVQETHELSINALLRGHFVSISALAVPSISGSTPYSSATTTAS